MIICLKSNIKEIRPILLITWTKVEFSGQNDDNNRNIKPWVLRIRKVSMLPWHQKKEHYNKIKQFPRNDDK